MKVRDWLERTVWTALSAFLGTVTASPLFDLDVSTLQAAGVAAAAAVINSLTVLARYRLSVLPNPGDGLPGLRTP